MNTYVVRRTIDAAVAGLVLGYALVALTNERTTDAVMLVSGITALALAMPMSRRVLVAWTSWASLRWKWRRRPASWHRWLWIVTLRYANGRER